MSSQLIPRSQHHTADRGSRCPELMDQPTARGGGDEVSGCFPLPLATLTRASQQPHSYQPLPWPGPLALLQRPQSRLSLGGRSRSDSEPRNQAQKSSSWGRPGMSPFRTGLGAHRSPLGTRLRGLRSPLRTEMRGSGQGQWRLRSPHRQRGLLVWEASVDPGKRVHVSETPTGPGATGQPRANPLPTTIRPDLPPVPRALLCRD